MLLTPRINDDRTRPAGSFVEELQGPFRQPAAPELARLIYEGPCEVGAGSKEEAPNDFAHLLNRGSSLE